jgi:hypothetical protein
MFKHLIVSDKSKGFTMGDVIRRIEEIEYEMSKTQKNKVWFKL